MGILKKMGYEPETSSTTTCDLDKLRKNAPTKRALAWELLKQTRNPQYVAMRYDYPLETMERALESIPEEKTVYQQTHGRRNSPPARTDDSSLKRASESIPEMARTREPGEDDE